MVVLFLIFAAVVLVLGVVDHFRPGRSAHRSARTTPFWLDDRGRGGSGGDTSGFSGGFDGGFSGGSGDGGGCSGGDGGGGGGSC